MQPDTGNPMNRQRNTGSRGCRAGRLTTAAVACILALVLAPKPAEGQVLILLFGEKLSTENFNIGLDLGVNFSNLTEMAGAERSRGLLLGLFAEWRFSENFHLQPGLVAISRKGAEGITPLPLGDSDVDPLVSGGSMTRDLKYLDIPVVLQYAVGGKSGLRIGAGPQLSILMEAVDRYEDRSAQGTTVKAENDVKDQLNGTDVGVVFDVEFEFSEGMALGARYFHGLTNTIESAGTSRNRVFSASIRVPIGRKSEGEGGAG